MKNRRFALYAAIAFLTSGCASTSYYQSPMHANSNMYKTVPLHSDTVKSATYVGAGFALGGANDDLSDVLFNFSATMHQAHNFGMFQAYYGITGGIGSYDLSFVDDDKRGSTSFRYWETSGGLNAVIPFGRGEWRLGGELSYSHEYGDYLDFRRKLPAGSADLNDTRNYHFTLGATSDILFKARHTIIGYKISPGINLNDLEGVHVDYGPFHKRTYYVTNCLHFHHDRLTCFVQATAGSYTFIVQSGLSVRVGR